MCACLPLTSIYFLCAGKNNVYVLLELQRQSNHDSGLLPNVSCF